MTEKNILLIDTSDIAAIYTAEAVKNLGYNPIYLCSIDSFQGDTRKQIQNYQWHNADTRSLDSLLEAIQSNKIQNIAGITTMLDSKLPVACNLANKLNVVGPDPAIINLSNKSWVYKTIAEFSPSFKTFESDLFPIDEVKEFLDLHKKIVLKPTSAAGGLGVHCISDHSQIENFYKDLHSDKFPGFIKNGAWVAQKHIDGQLVSLEGYVANSKVNYLGYTNRRKIGNTETGGEFPINMSIPGDIRDKMQLILETLVQRAQFQWGYFHTEFVWNNNECVLIDANMGRIGGGALGQQIAMAYGLEPIQVYQHIIDLSIFKSTNSFSCIYQQQPKKTVGLLYGVQEEGMLINVMLPALINSHHTQLLDNDTSVPSLGINNWSWIGILTGYPENVYEEIDKIRIETSKGIFKPHY